MIGYPLRLVGLNAIALCAVSFWIAMGVRGWGRVDRDYGTLHPFVAPLGQCAVTITSIQDGITVPLSFPALSYLHVPRPLFMGMSYLEALPGYARGLERYMIQSGQSADVRIECKQMYGSHAVFSSDR